MSGGATSFEPTPPEPGAGDGVWWGEFDIPEGSAGHWQLGPLVFHAWHSGQQEWRLAHERLAERSEEAVEVKVPIDGSELTETDGVLRVVSHRLEGPLRLLPRLADRPVVVRPEKSLSILPRGEVGLFVATPVWLVVSAGEPGHEVLELATERLSDTWLGPSTRHGELCYAIRTMARLDLSNVTPRRHRAITKLLLRNSADDPLPLERLSLPAPDLSLFADEHGYLWTQSLTVERDRSGTLAEVRLEKAPPLEARGATRVAPSRHGGERGLLVRAMSALLA